MLDTYTILLKVALLGLLCLIPTQGINTPQLIPTQFSPFFSYLLPQNYHQYPPSHPSSSPSYVLPAHTSLIQSPLKTLSLFPDLYRDSRAICSFCRYPPSSFLMISGYCFSCATDYGCAYNCHKCPALCYTCDCSSSLGCRYNCDKCQVILYNNTLLL